MQKILIIAALVALGASPLVIGGTAEAKQPRKAPGTITVCSKSGGFDCYTARVVSSPVGRKVVLRGGAAFDCGYDCRETLRVRTVDFWENQRLNGG